MTRQRALITGIAGQDGRFLADLLHEKGYEVFGLVKGEHNSQAEVLHAEHPHVTLVQGDLTDSASLIRAVEVSQPHEVYNFAAISFVAMSFHQAELTANVTGTGVLRMLEAIRTVGGNDSAIRFCQASSSEMFGKARQVPQTEMTPFHPRSPYGCAKVYGHDITVNYRETYGMFACSSILFNHESERRGLEFVTRKITNAAARIRLGLQDSVSLGNLDPRRDWGYAGDYVEAMWRMLQQDEPDDYIVATGETFQVRDFVAKAFARAGIDDWESHVIIDPRFYRPVEADQLIGDPSKAESRLGWRRNVSFDELVNRMVDHDLAVETKALSAR